MSAIVCLGANTLHYPQGGGHLWAFLNWALGLRALGCRVIWLEAVSPRTTAEMVAGLAGRLGAYGLPDGLALVSWTDAPVAPALAENTLDLEAALEADLLLNFQYCLPVEVVRRFRRSALVDIDPGLVQGWVSRGVMKVAPHDLYFSTGETVGRPEARFPDAGLGWLYTPPCVALDWWPPSPSPGAAFTTVSHWQMQEWAEDGDHWYQNDKRSGFLPFLDLPRRVAQPLELALCLSADEEAEREDLTRRGWRVRHAYAVSATPWDYQVYVQGSAGEFSCVKPSCVRLQNAWISDRSLCYLASGKPVVVQHTGPSRVLPDAAGLFRFRDLDEAVRCLETATADYARHGALARALAEEYFDARKIARGVLERALS